MPTPMPARSAGRRPDGRSDGRAVGLAPCRLNSMIATIPSYPMPAELKSKIRWGNVEFDGDISKDSPGSDLIKSLLLDDQPGPLYLLAWGGGSTIARALKSIQDQYQS